MLYLTKRREKNFRMTEVLESFWLNPGRQNADDCSADMSGAGGS